MLPAAIQILKKDSTLFCDPFRKIKILESIRENFGELWFVSDDLLKQLRIDDIDDDIHRTVVMLRILNSRAYLDRQMLPFKGKTTYLRPHYRLSQMSKDYVKKYGSFANPLGKLFRNKRRLYDKVRNGAAASWA